MTKSVIMFRVDKNKEEEANLLVLSFEPMEFCSYEIYNFVESCLKVDVDDVSICHDSYENPTGNVLVLLSEKIPVSRASRLASLKFKDSPVDIRLFPRRSEFEKYIKRLTETKLPEYQDIYKNAPPMVYVANFNGSEQDVRDFFGKCGSISLLRSFPYHDSQYWMISYTTEEDALYACKTFNGFEDQNGQLIVMPMYKRAVERTFIIEHCDDINWLKQELSAFGKIEQIQNTTDGRVFVMMETLEPSKAACTLINSRVYNGQRISAHFVDYEYFYRGVRNI